MDFWYAYVCAGAGCAVALVNFFRYEPLIVAKCHEDRGAIRPEE